MEHSEEIKKRMEQMEVRFNQYEQDFRSKKSCSPGAAVSKNLIYSKKRQLKGSGVVITESLTKRRLKLLEAAKSAFGRFSAWSMKGDVYVFHNKKHLVNDFVDITRIKNISTYASVTTKNLTNYLTN